MPVILLFLKKLAPYLKYILMAALIFFLIFSWWGKRQENTKLQQALDLYKRQMAGQLSDKEKQLEQQNLALGVAQSQLLDAKGLNKAYEADKIATSAKFEQFKKTYQLQLDSYQKTIAQLKEELKGGNTSVAGSKERQPTDPQPNVDGSDHVIDPKTEILPYTWKSEDGRFELDDPDVFVKDNENFKLNQHFRITGEIYKQKVGFLKTSHLTLEELVVVGTNKDGTPIYKLVGQADIVDSKFNYTEESPDAWVPKKGIFGVWGIVTANIALHNGTQPRLLIGTGLEFIQWKGLGVGVQLYLDPKVIGDSGFGVGLSYRPTIKDVRLNLGINLSIATTFTQPFQSYMPMLGLVFYLW